MPEKDIKTYGISYRFSIYGKFDLEEEAIELVALLNTFKSIGNGYENRLAYVEPELSYSKQNKEIANEVEKKNKAFASEYKSKLALYNEFLDKKADIEKPIWDKVNHSVEKWDNFRFLKNEYQTRYLPLADGNIRTAIAFLKNTFSVSDEAESFILSK